LATLITTYELYSIDDVEDSPAHIFFDKTQNKAKCDYSNLNHYLEKVNWAEELGKVNIDEAWEKLKIIIHNRVHSLVLIKNKQRFKKGDNQEISGGISIKGTSCGE